MKMKHHISLSLISCYSLLKSAVAEGDAVLVNLAAQNQQNRSRVRNQMLFRPLAKDPCPAEGTPMTCQGVIPLNLENSSEISFNWFASGDNDKYLSIDVSQNTEWINFNFRAKYSCDNDSSYQEFHGDDISVDVELYNGESLPSGFKLNHLNTEIALGKCIGCTYCQIFARIRYDLDDTVGNFSLNMYRISSTAKYDNQKVASGSKDYVWDNRLRSIEVNEPVRFSLIDRPVAPSSRPSILQSIVSPAPAPLPSSKLSPAPSAVPMESPPTPEISVSAGQVQLTDSSGCIRWVSSLLIANIIGIVIMI